MNFFLFVAVMAMFPAFGFAQFSVSGIITDSETSDPLLGAHVVVKGTYRAVSADNKGYYKIDKLKKGSYTLIVSYVGYQTLEKEIKIKSNERLNFTLQTRPVLEDAVIIKATRADEKSPYTYTNISRKNINNLNLGQDLPVLLEFSPSIVTTSDAGNGIGYSGMRIRGTDMTRINVTINGIPYNDPESHGVFWVDLPDFASSVDNIQIQRGVGTSTNGAAAFGASINIQTTKMSTESYGEIQSSFGSFNTLKNTLLFGTGLINGKWSIDGRLSKINSDGYIDRASSDLKSYFITGSLYGKNSLLKVNMFSGKEKTYQAWYGVPKDSLETNRTYNPYTYENQTDNYQQDHYQVIYSKDIRKDLNVNIALFYIKGKGYYEAFEEDATLTDFALEPVITGNDTITDSDIIQQKWLDNDFYGATYSLKYKRSKTEYILGGAVNKYVGDHFGEVIWAQHAGNSEIRHRWYDNQGVKTDFNIFGKTTVSLHEKLNLFVDLQFRSAKIQMDGIHDDFRNLSQEHTFNFINPKLGCFFVVNEKHQTYFSFAISNREPSRTNYRDADNGYQPKSEKLLNYELGYNFRTQRILLNLNLFHMSYKDQLVLTGEINNVGAAIMTNVPESYRTGLELSLGLKLAQKIHWQTNMSLSTNKIKNYTEYVDNWDTWTQIANYLGETDLSFSPAVVSGSIIEYTPFKGFQVQFLSKYVGKQFIDNTSSDERSLDPYFVNNVKFSYSVKALSFEEIQINFLFNNIFNVLYENNAWAYRYYESGTFKVLDGYFPQAGRQFFCGIILKL